MSASSGKKRFLQDMLFMALSSASAYFLVRYAISKIADPESGKREEEIKRTTAILRRLEPDDGDSDDGSRRGPRPSAMDLNEYERRIVGEVVAPEDIKVSFEGMFQFP
jgi:ATPase family AAA domain-containing protein 1